MHIHMALMARLKHLSDDLIRCLLRQKLHMTLASGAQQERVAAVAFKLGAADTILHILRQYKLRSL